jgi:acyl-CoA oxidase
MVIAEGDITTLCIRLFSELILGRYALPLPAKSESVLANHAHGALEFGTHLLRDSAQGHRDQKFQYLALPIAESSVAALGHAMAYSAAQKAGVSRELLQAFELGVMDLDPLWYFEHEGVGHLERLKRKANLMQDALPRLPTYLDSLGVEKYVRASIVREDSLKSALEKLPSYSRDDTQSTAIAKL